MFTLLIILCWIAVALIYLLQFQIVRNYKSLRYVTWDRDSNFYTNPQNVRFHNTCILERESIFKWRKIT